MIIYAFIHALLFVGMTRNYWPTNCKGLRVCTEHSLGRLVPIFCWPWLQQKILVEGIGFYIESMGLFRAHKGIFFGGSNPREGRILKWRYVSTIFQGIFSRDIREKIGLIYGRDLQFRFLKWPVKYLMDISMVFPHDFTVTG